MTDTCKFNNKELGDIDVVSMGEPSNATPPMSRTNQYRKVMKPLLERKRRARINSYLDELKDLMVTALQSEGESITKLEKADVLELTLKHLQKLKRQQMLETNPAIDVDRYRAGYTACATEVGRMMSSIPGVNIRLGTQLMSYLGKQVTCLKPSPGAFGSPQQTSRLSIPPMQHQLPSHLNQYSYNNHGHNATGCVSSASVQIPKPSFSNDSLSERGRSDPEACSPVSDKGYYSGRDSSPTPSDMVSSPIINFQEKPRAQEKVEAVWRPF